jgi:hypothetical protein
MRIGVCGMMKYAELVLNSEKAPMYIPALHGNQSSLEAWFGMTRGTGNDTAANYPGWVGAADTAREMDFLDNNKMYTKDDICSEKEKNTGDLMTGRNDGARKRWLAKHLLLRTQDVKMDVALFYKQEEHVRRHQGAKQILIAKVLTHMEQNGVIRCHFCDLLVEEPVILEYAKVSLGTGRQPWFEALLLMTTGTKLVFDTACQKLMSDLLVEPEQGMAEKKHQ